MRTHVWMLTCLLLASCASWQHKTDAVQAQRDLEQATKQATVSVKPPPKPVVRVETPPPTVIVKSVVVEQPVTCQLAAQLKPSPLPVAPSVEPGHVTIPSQRISLLQNYIFLLLDYIKAEHETEVKQYQSYLQACQTPVVPKPATP